MGIPVKVYTSAMTDAPQLVGSRGDLKMVLKACLATGFGAGNNRQEPLGWEIVPGTESADGFSCAFRPTSINSAKNIIKVDCTATYKAQLTAWFDTAADGSLVNGSSNMEEWPFWGNGGMDWYLIGHEQSFLFVVRWRGRNSSDSPGGVSRAMFFGAMNDGVHKARGNTLLLRIAGSYTVLNNYNPDGIEAHLSPDYNRMSLSADGMKYWVSVKPWWQMGEISVGYSKVNGDMYFSKVAMTEGGEFRGFLPFGYLVHHKLKSPDNFTIKKIGGVDHLLAQCGQGLRENETYGISLPFLINLSEWDY